MKERKKFNTGKSKHYFAFNKIQFNTDEHPIVLNGAKRNAKVQAKLSFTETQYREFLSNALQVDGKTAVRIAVYEVIRKGTELPKEILELADFRSTHRNHKNRDRDGYFKVPMAEKKLIEAEAKKRGLLTHVFIRAALLHVVSELRSGSRYSIHNSPKIPVDELARDWYAGKQADPNNVRESKLTPLREANKKAYNEAAERGSEADRKAYEQRGLKIDEMVRQGLGHLISDGEGVDLSRVDALNQADADAYWDSLPREQKINQQVDLLMRGGVPFEEAEAEAQRQIPEEPDEMPSEQPELSEWQRYQQRRAEVRSRALDAAIEAQIRALRDNRHG